MNIVTIGFGQPMSLLIKGVTVELTAINKDKWGNIRFGIQAPKTIAINRQEIYKKKNRQIIKE